MNVVKKVAKTKEDALNLVLDELEVKEEDICYSFAENKGGLFKGITYECSGLLKQDVILELEKYLKTIMAGLGLEANFEVQTKDNLTTIKIYSSNNAIIIGKNGQNLAALTLLAKQFVKNLCTHGLRILLDVENYKDKKLKNIERLAKNLAKEVVKSKIDVEMDNMNSYERRVVHNVLSDFEGVVTQSVGEEPNRHVIIKYKE